MIWQETFYHIMNYLQVLHHLALHHQLICVNRLILNFRLTIPSFRIFKCNGCVYRVAHIRIATRQRHSSDALHSHRQMPTLFRFPALLSRWQRLLWGALGSQRLSSNTGRRSFLLIFSRLDYSATLINLIFYVRSFFKKW